jgi:hypothetical protein
MARRFIADPFDSFVGAIEELSLDVGKKGNRGCAGPQGVCEGSKDKATAEGYALPWTET